MTRDSLRRAAPIAATLRHHGDEHHARAVEEMERQRSVAIIERGAALSRVEAVLARLDVDEDDPDPIRALESWAEKAHARAAAAADERNRFINANAELGLLVVRQGYALRVLRGAVEALRSAVGERERDRAEAAAAHDDTGKAAADHAAARVAVQAAFTALAEALDETAGECRGAAEAHAQLEAERDRLQRACDEGLPREAIFCPSCGARHVEGPRHDDPTVDGRTRPHHTHRCYGCGHVWDSGRWSFGVAEGEERPADALADLAALKTLASRAYRSVTQPGDVDQEKHLATPIHPDYDADNSEAPRLVLAYDLGGMLPAEGSGPTPWQASVEYEGGMGGVPVIAGNARATAAEAVASLREELEAAEDDGGADDGSVE